MPHNIGYQLSSTNGEVDDNERTPSNDPVSRLEVNTSMVPSTGSRDVVNDPATSFKATFGDAYTFRNLIEFIFTVSRAGTFIFTNEYIHFVQSEAERILIDVVFSISDLIEYEYDSNSRETLVHIDIETMRSITRDIQKKDSLTIQKLPNDVNIFLEINGNSSGSDNQGNIGHMQPLRITNIPVYEIDNYSRPETTPNCTSLAYVFSKACTSLQHVGDQDIEIRGYHKGITFAATVHDSTAGKVYRFGTVTDDEMSDAVNSSSISTYHTGNNSIIKIIDDFDSKAIHIDGNDKNKGGVPVLHITSNILKSLAKINSLTSNGPIKIFVEKDLPMKLISYVGNYAIVRVYVRPNE